MSIDTTGRKVLSRRLEQLLREARPIPGFDCVEMKRQGQERIRQELEGLSPEEVREYWRKAHEELLALQARLRTQLEAAED